MPRFRVRKADSMDTAAEVLQLVQQAAEQAIADAQREAEEIRARARQEAEQIIADAKARAERLLGPVEQTLGHAAGRVQVLTSDSQRAYRRGPASRPRLPRER